MICFAPSQLSLDMHTFRWFVGEPMANISSSGLKLSISVCARALIYSKIEFRVRGHVIGFCARFRESASSSVASGRRLPLRRTEGKGERFGDNKDEIASLLLLKPDLSRCRSADS